MKVMYDVVAFLRRRIFFRRLCLLTSQGCGDHPEKYCCHGDLQQAAHSSPKRCESTPKLSRDPFHAPSRFRTAGFSEQCPHREEPASILEIGRTPPFDRTATSAILLRFLRSWRNWQTHQLEGLAVAIPWWFESTRPHHSPSRAQITHLPSIGYTPVTGSPPVTLITHLPLTRLNNNWVVFKS